MIALPIFFLKNKGLFDITVVYAKINNFNHRFSVWNRKC
jgi:hypothetical protein